LIDRCIDVEALIVNISFLDAAISQKGMHKFASSECGNTSGSLFT
jgi:hypothetical protein